MKNKAIKKDPGIIYRGGKASAVILDINEYKEMLEKLDDIEDLKMLAQMRKKPIRYKSLEEFLKECRQGV